MHRLLRALWCLMISLLSRSSRDRTAPLQTLLEEVPPRRGVGFFFFFFASVKRAPGWVVLFSFRSQVAHIPLSRSSPDRAAPLQTLLMEVPPRWVGSIFPCAVRGGVPGLRGMVHGRGGVDDTRGDFLFFSLFRFYLFPDGSA
jgi:hypothetical protein